ncbi:hypothetical protein AUEXF2481DRAFT_527643 [Aureobasidium subglaciale EXF-2481]|uniref:RING-type domain-containing protein n=1 Tax=Aureobasidium subglaciale (strain EXF-2481) TaxID=1043005 RepID=A0A074Y4C6_AURSE|nr:uncharacterized protein AUEXF2481DRAFT_527643 [Aureobasidium subglaciale EXF-2481]KEQ90814.1 hypothetical protein AUEXF2481DRAFT_527643 [Aureobasidium subglaciale EXF-2481]
MDPPAYDLHTFHRPGLPSLLRDTITDEDIAAVYKYFTVPEDVFAESCPTCDEIAADAGLVVGDGDEYPAGWKLIACRRHAQVLKDQNDDARYAEPQAEPQADSVPEKTPTTTTSTSTDEICPICVDAKAKLTIDCGHSFCAHCITEWQQNYTDEKLADWLDDCPEVLEEYRILKAHLKSRYTCPMCRTYLQHTKLSRREKRAWNDVVKGLPPLVSARSRRGGQNRRRARAGEGLRSEAPSGMPLIRRSRVMGPTRLRV